MGFSRWIAAAGILGAAAALASCGSTAESAVAEKSGVLDGTAYAVSVRAEGEEPTRDRLVFSNGWFESTACRRDGFELGRYESGPEGPGLGFAATCRKPSDSRYAWHGVIVGDHVEGTIVRTPASGGAPQRSTFFGDRER